MARPIWSHRSSCRLRGLTRYPRSDLKAIDKLLEFLIWRWVYWIVTLWFLLVRLGYTAYVGLFPEDIKVADEAYYEAII